MHLRPTTQDYAPSFHTYIRLVPPGDLIEILSRQLHETEAMLAQVSEDQAGFRYAEGKWSLKQALGHVIDSERIFAYRALRIGRNDPTPLAGFDQDILAAGAPYDQIPLAEALREFEAVRSATLFLLRGFPPEAWDRSGTSNEHHITLLAIACAIAGHELHHREILRTLYVPGISQL
jgi:hypothetical protein